MQLIVPDEALRQSGLTEREFRLQVASTLYQNDLVTLRMASAMVEVSELEFCQYLKSKGIPTYYDLDDLEEDLKTIDTLRQSNS